MVEVVGGLVEQQHVGAREEDARQFDAAPLPAGEGVEALAQDPVRQPQGVGDLGGLGVGGPPALVGELLVKAHVALHGPLLARALGGGHLLLGAPDAGDDLVDAPHRHDAVAGQHRLVADVGVLREVADGARGGDRPRVLRRAPAVGLPGQQAHGRGLSGAVAPHEADAHALVDAEAGVAHEFARSDSQ